MDINTFLTNLKSSLELWGNGVIMIIGIVMIIIGGWKIASGLISHGKKQVSWVVAIALIMIGGLMLGAGFGGLKTFADIGNQTLTNMAGGGGGGPAGP